MSGSMRSPGMTVAGSVPLVLVLLMLVAVADRPANALDCYQCGQYNEGVGSITPCLIYSEPLEKEHLKKCPRESDKFCIKYVSELSVVRDCVAECKEKEVWETRTYCCNEDGCNHGRRIARNADRCSGLAGHRGRFGGRLATRFAGRRLRFAEFRSRLKRRRR